MTDHCAVSLRIDGVIAANDNAPSGLPEMVRKAAEKLASATTAAEVLDAKASAGLAYDAAKAAARFAKAKGAYDDVIGAVYRAQADALEIEAMAKRRLADEYDAGQERGEFGRSGARTDLVPKWNEVIPSAADLGLTRKDIYEARQVRDAELAEPGIVRRALDARLLAGEEPTKAAVAREINTRLSSYSGDNEWYTPARYVEMAREVMGAIETDPASNATAQRTVRAATYYTAETNGLDKDWHGKVWMNPPYSNPEVQQFAEKLISEYRIGNISEAVVLTNNCADTGWHRTLQDACTRMCTTTGRIRFESPTRQGNSPAMGNHSSILAKIPISLRKCFPQSGTYGCWHEVSGTKNGLGLCPARMLQSQEEVKIRGL